MIVRESPVSVPAGFGEPVFEEQGGRRVLWTIRETGEADVLVCDMSHRPKALLLDVEGDHPAPGGARWDGGAWTGTLSPGETCWYDLLGDLGEVRLPEGAVDMTDAWALLVVFGPRAPELMHRLTALDTDPALRKEPLFLATRSHNAGVRILNTKGPMGFLVACDRSYGQDLYAACLHAPAPPVVKPAGVLDYAEWLQSAGGGAGQGRA